MVGIEYQVLGIAPLCRLQGVGLYPNEDLTQGVLFIIFMQVCKLVVIVHSGSDPLKCLLLNEICLRNVCFYPLKATFWGAKIAF
jgi:hypothetical protein